MEDAAPMSIIHGVADGSEQGRCFPGWNRTIGEPSGQGRALDQPHGEVGLPLMIAHRVHRDDMWVIELGRRAGLCAESGHIECRGRGSVEQDLQRHDPTQAGLPGPIDHTHPAPAELFQKFAVADARERDSPLRPLAHCGTRLRRERCREVHFGRSSQFLRDLGRQPELAQLIAKVGMLTNDSVEVRNSSLTEFFGQLGQDPGELIVPRGVEGFERHGVHGHPA